MKKKNRKVLLSGSSTLLVSSLLGSSVPGNVSAGGKEILGWIAAKFWALVACVGSIFTSSDSDIKENVEDIVSNNSDIEEKGGNIVNIRKALSEKGTEEELKVSEEKSEKRKLSMKERFEHARKLAEKLKEKLGDKIQLSPEEENGRYSGEIKFNNSINFNTDIKIIFFANKEKFLVSVGGVSLGTYCVQKEGMTEEDKINNVINYVVDWYRGAEARLKKLDELAETGKFDLVKDPDALFVKLYPKDNLKLRIEDEGNGLEGVAGTVAYNVVTDKLSFYYDRNLDMYSHSAVSGFIELSFRSNDLKKVTDKKEVSKNLSIFNRFVNQIKSNTDSNDVTFEVSGEDASVEDNQEILDAADLCF